MPQFLKDCRHVVQSFKKCVVCERNLPINRFYCKQGRNESQTRWDAQCKVCKKGRLKVSRIAQVSTSTSVQQKTDFGGELRHDSCASFIEKQDFQRLLRVFLTLQTWRDEELKRKTPETSRIEPKSDSSMV